MTWTCSTCGAESDVRLATCSACWSWGSFWPAVRRPQAFLMPDEAVVSARQLWGSVGHWRPLADLASVLGALPEAPHVGLVYGAPGSGKSTFLLHLADALRIGGPIIYNAIEEGPSAGFAARLRRLELRADDILICVRNDLSSLAALAREHGATAIMLDSLTWSALQAEDVARLAREADAAVWFSTHATKAGGPRGPLSLAHVADVVLALGPGGQFELQKSRFADLRSGVVPWWT